MLRPGCLRSPVIERFTSSYGAKAGVVKISCTAKNCLARTTGKLTELCSPLWIFTPSTLAANVLRPGFLPPTSFLKPWYFCVSLTNCFGWFINKTYKYIIISHVPTHLSVSLCGRIKKVDISNVFCKSVDKAGFTLRGWWIWLQLA